MKPINYNTAKKEEYLPMDILSGMIYYMPTEKSLGTIGDIHSRIYKIKKDYKLLDNFPFSTKGISPVSDELGKTIFDLMFLRGIYPGPFVMGKGEKIKIREGFKKYIENKVLPLFNEEELKQLKEMANDYVKVASKYVK